MINSGLRPKFKQPGVNQGMTEQNSNQPQDKPAWIEAYNKLVHYTREELDDLREKSEPALQEAMEKAKDKISELGELTREEAEKVSDYVVRDLHSAGEFIAEGEREIADWLRLDLMIIEDRLLDSFSKLVDQTREELDYIRARADALGEWHTGEIAGIGVLKCKSCGQLVHFENTGHIPPCPKCHGTKFNRLEP
jgi:rubrerythrin